MDAVLDFSRIGQESRNLDDMNRVLSLQRDGSHPFDYQVRTFFPFMPFVLHDLLNIGRRKREPHLERRSSMCVSAEGDEHNVHFHCAALKT
jgi:hypothetical protein